MSDRGYPLSSPQRMPTFDLTNVWVCVKDSSAQGSVIRIRRRLLVRDDVDDVAHHRNHNAVALSDRHPSGTSRAEKEESPTRTCTSDLFPIYTIAVTKLSGLKTPSTSASSPNTH